MAEGRGGVVKKFLDHTTPSAPSEEASRYFSCVASTPPPAEEGSLEPHCRGSVTRSVELALMPSVTTCLRPEGQSTSTRSTAVASLSPK